LRVATTIGAVSGGAGGWIETDLGPSMTEGVKEGCLTCSGVYDNRGPSVDAAISTAMGRVTSDPAEVGALGLRSHVGVGWLTGAIARFRESADFIADLTSAAIAAVGGVATTPVGLDAPRVTLPALGIDMPMSALVEPACAGTITAT
jgi:hypothetical protein